MNTTTFAILVHGSASNCKSHQSAQDFIGAAKKLGHSIDSVFFYGDATSITLQNSSVCRVQKNWLKLSLQYQFPLQTCISTAINRGVIDTQLAEETGEPVNLMEGFTLEGLGALAETIHHNCRIIEFGA